MGRRALTLEGKGMFIYSVETMVTAALIAILVLIKAWISVSDWWKYRKCEHLDYREIMSCDAICKNCGKNLGFIGTVRSGRG